MRPPVTVTLIMMGTLLLLAPIGADYLFQRNVASVLLKGVTPTAVLVERLSEWHRIGCFVAGSLMIGVGILGAMADARIPYYVDESDDTDEEEEGKPYPKKLR